MTSISGNLGASAQVEAGIQRQQEAVTRVSRQQQVAEEGAEKTADSEAAEQQAAQVRLEQNNNAGVAREVSLEQLLSQMNKPKPAGETKSTPSSQELQASASEAQKTQDTAVEQAVSQLREAQQAATQYGYNATGAAAHNALGGNLGILDRVV